LLHKSYQTGEKHKSPAGEVGKKTRKHPCFTETAHISICIIEAMKKPSLMTLLLAIAATAISTPPASYADTGATRSGEKAIERGVASDQSFFGRHREGWFFYNEKIDPEKKKEKKLEPRPEQQARQEPPKEEMTPEKRYSGPPPLSAAWLKVNLPKYLNAALDNPSPENVRTYLLLQKLSLDKSTKFSEMAQRVSLTDPMLDEVTRRPLATSGTHIAGAIARKKSEALLTDMAKSMGLFVYYSRNCPYCGLTGALVSAYKRLYGFTVLPISLDGSAPPEGFPLDSGWRVNNGQAEKMKVAASPAIYLVNVEKNDFISVAQGSSISMEEMKQRVLLAALQKHWITDDQYKSALPNNNVPLLTDSGGEWVATDPHGFVNQSEIVKLFEGGMVE